MKLVIHSNQYCSLNEFDRIMELVKSTGQIVSEITNDIDYIFIEYKRLIYKFNRYDDNFINKVEQAIETNPYNYTVVNKYLGHLHICEIDDRFTDKKYYKIDNRIRYDERLEIFNNLIIDDLYYKNYVLNSIITSRQLKY